MEGRTRWIALAAVAFAACGPGESPRGARAPAAATPTATPARTPPPSPRPLPDPVRVGSLPDAGVVVAASKTVWFVDVYGAVVGELDGFELAGNPGNDGVWLERGRDYFRLAAGRGILVPVPRHRARERIYDETAPERLRRPEEGRGPVPGSGFAGRWRFAHPGPGGVVLAQWSGECEVPTAYWKAPGLRPEIVTGGHDLASAPESFALGWAGERALVHLRDGACGMPGDPPGIYAFTSPGAGGLLYETPPDARTDMWGGTSG